MVEQSWIIIRTFHQNKNIYLEIEDNGCGIPEEVLDRIYEPAFTMEGSRDITGSYKSSIKGTGYGMANAKKYIEQHKGNIIIDSKAGKGTKITISFPVIKKELTATMLIMSQNPAKIKIMCVPLMIYWDKIICHIDQLINIHCDIR